VNDWLNYHHLLYFWVVAKEGGVSRASEQLHLAQPTISNQLAQLEKSIGSKLFDRVGRSMVLTETGQLVFRYANEIFSLGQELSDVLQGRVGHDNIRLRVGVPDVLPKLVVYHLLKPVLDMEETVQLVNYEGKLQDLLTDLAMHRLDVVLADSPVTPATNIRAFNHLLGESGITILGTAKLARKYQENFPQSLSDAPMLLPTQTANLRRGLEQWFDSQSISPRVVHEIEDSAVLKVFGQHGEGLFAAPTIVEDEIQRQYRVQVVGRTTAVMESYYAISFERRLKHPAVVKISTAAKEGLFRLS
jgi:LysR family transcriptional activator of nhaA